MREMLNKIFDRFKVNETDRKEIIKIILPIISHEEFINRCHVKLYPHHDNISLGEHIMSVAVVSYLKAKKKYNDKDTISLCVIIAMFHDLYELPWQNAKSKKKLFNKHGFVHPIEGIINAINWYPDYFKDLERSKLIIDAVIHHMYPFPARCIIGDIESLDLNNYEKFYMLDDCYKEMIIASSNRHKVGCISICRSYYKLGDIVSKADKTVSFNNDLKLSKLITLITGVNKDLDNYSKN